MSSSSEAAATVDNKTRSNNNNSHCNKNKNKKKWQWPTKSHYWSSTASASPTATAALVEESRDSNGSTSSNSNVDDDESLHKNYERSSRARAPGRLETFCSDTTEGAEKVEENNNRSEEATLHVQQQPQQQQPQELSNPQKWQQWKNMFARKNANSTSNNAEEAKANTVTEEERAQAKAQAEAMAAIAEDPCLSILLDQHCPGKCEVCVKEEQENSELQGLSNKDKDKSKHRSFLEMWVGESDAVTTTTTTSTSTSKDTISNATRNNTNNNRRKRNNDPCLCLICTSPVCSKHAAPDFRKEGVTICSQKCDLLFHLDYLLEKLRSEEKDLESNHPNPTFQRILQAYHRATFMLQQIYNKGDPLIKELIQALENNRKTLNHRHLTNSGMGIMAGVTGVGAVAGQAAAAINFSAAATLLTPVGPPLLLASILIGCTAATASLTTEAINHWHPTYSEPNHMANKIIVLYQLINTLQTVMMKYLSEDEKEEEEEDDNSSCENENENAHEKNEDILASIAKTESLVRENDMKDDSMEEAKDIDTTDAQRNKPTNKVKMAVNDTNKDEEEPDAHTDITTVTENSDDDETNKQEDVSSTEEKEKVVSKTAQKNKKNKMACAMPLAPLADDAVLSVMQIFSSKTNSASMAVSQVSSNAMKVAQVATIACGTLSAATVILEARNINKTLESLKAGSPCEKAQLLRIIQEKVETILTPQATTMVAQEWENVVLHNNSDTDNDDDDNDDNETNHKNDENSNT